MICPQCRSEYIDGITECRDCLVPLVDAIPPDSADHTVIAYDLSDWSDDKVATLGWRLDREEIEHALSERVLTVAHAHESAVDALIDVVADDELEETPEDMDVDGDGVAVETPYDDPDRSSTATVLQRVAGYVVDYPVALACLTLALNVGGFPHRSPGEVRIRLLVGGVAFALYRAGCFARWGQTIGYRVVRMRVVDATTNAAPTIGAALLRVGVTVVPNALSTAIAGPSIVSYVVNVAASAWTAAVVISIALALDHRGFHDRTSRTVVTRY